MGYNAVVMVLCDRLSEIEKDPDFGKKLVRAIMYRSARAKRPEYDVSEPYVTGQTEVISVQHADTAQIVVIGGNTGRVLGFGSYDQNDNDLIWSLERDRRMRRRAVSVP